MKAPQRPKHPILLCLYSLIALLLCLPLAALVYLSLARQWSFPALIDASFGVASWSLALGGTQGLVESLLLSTGIATSIAAACTIAGFIIARSIAYHPWRRGLLSMAYYPYLIAPVILGVMLRFYFIKLGISGTVIGVWMAQFLFIFPFAILFFAGFWSHRIQEMEGQDMTLGASPTQVFYRVLLPAAIMSVS